MTKVILHVGTHKTGTSALQRVLKDSAEDLDKAGIKYVQARDFTGKTLKEIMLAEDVDSELVAAVRKAINAKKKGAKTVLVSAEQFSGNPFTGYSNNDVVSKILAEAVGEATVISYFRRQDRFIESIYAQIIHEGKLSVYAQDHKGKSPSFHEVYGDILRYEHSMNYAWMSDNWAAAFGADNYIARLYDNVGGLSNPAGIVNDFGKIIGSKLLTEMTEAPVVIPSFSYEALLVARRLNDLIDAQHHKRMRAILQRKAHKKAGDRGYGFFEPQAAWTLLYRCDNARFYRQYAHSKFPDGFSDGGTDPEADDLLDIIELLFSEKFLQVTTPKKK